MDHFSVPSGLLSVPQAIRDRARERPDAPAILAPGRTPLTYAALWEQVERTIGKLREFGVGPDDRVALVLPNGPEMAVALVATIRGAVAAPMNTDLGAAEFEASLAGLRARAVVVPAGSDSPIRQVAAARGLPLIELRADLGAPAGTFSLSGEAATTSKTVAVRADLADQTSATSSESLDPRRLALILQTSGTTSRPKTFAMDDEALRRLTAGVIDISPRTADDRCLNLMPMFHLQGAINAVLGSLSVGGSVICAPGLVLPDFFEWLDALRPTWYVGVPAMHGAILAEAPRHREITARSPLRFIRSASSALSPDLQSRVEATFGVPVIDAYGMTETGTLAYYPPLSKRRVGSVGIAVAPSVVVVDGAGSPLPPNVEGEIATDEARVLRPEGEDLPASSFVNGWFRTGDLGYIDEDRYVFITGRAKELINRGGEKISPQEVEAALLQHPDVAEAVAFAVPHPRLGEGVAAAAVPRAGASVTSRALREFAAGHLARHKVPQTVLVVPTIPRGPTGKYQRIGMAERLGLAGGSKHLEGIKQPARSATEIASADRTHRDAAPAARGGGLDGRAVNGANRPRPSGRQRTIPLPFRAGITPDRSDGDHQSGGWRELCGLSPDPTLPRDETEARLTAIWERLLGSGPVGVDEDFFALGGDSLLALQLLLEVEREFGTRFSDSVLYEASTVAGLARVLRSRRPATERVSVARLTPGGSLAPLFVCMNVGTAGATTYRHLARYIGTERPLIGIQSRGLDERGVPQRSLEEIAADYVARMLKVQPAGPYHLCGHSAGGLIAYEAAQQLVAQGREVAFLGLIDTACPGHEEPTGEELNRHVLTVVSLRPRELLAYLRPRVIDKARMARTGALRALQRALPNLRVGGRYETLWAKAGASTAYRAYVPRPYAGRVTLFQATRRPPRYHAAPQLGWRKYAAGGFHVRDVEGDHVSLLTDDNSRELASALNACLRAEPS